MPASTTPSPAASPPNLRIESLEDLLTALQGYCDTLSRAKTKNPAALGMVEDFVRQLEKATNGRQSASKPRDERADTLFCEQHNALVDICLMYREPVEAAASNRPTNEDANSPTLLAVANSGLRGQGGTGTSWGVAIPTVRKKATQQGPTLRPRLRV